jgi:hypothetical protein
MIELTRPKFSGIAKVYEMIDSGTESLPVGGTGGLKFRIVIRNPRYHDGRDGVCEVLPFILKKCNGVNEEAILDDIQVYDDLRRRGYPVPQTIRCCKKDGEIYLLMSDLTCQGEYIVWGPSRNMSRQQYKDLLLMNLTDKEIESIEGKARSFAEQATEDGIALGHNCYHVRKNPNTGEVNIVFLDVDWSARLGIFVGDSLLEFNESSADTFMESLRSSISRAKEEMPQSSS